MEDVTTIGQIMTPVQDVISLNEDVRTARRRLQSEATRSLIVVDGDGPVGVLEWRQIMHMNNDDEMDSPVAEVMARAFPELTPDMTIEAANERLADVDVGMLPVIDATGTLVGEVPRSAISHHESVVNQAHVPDAPTVEMQPGGMGKLTAVAAGMTVNGANGSKIGEVSDLAVGPTGQLDAIHVAHGLFGRKHKRVTADLISNVENDQVELVIDQPEFKALPDLEQAEERV